MPSAGIPARPAPSPLPCRTRGEWSGWLSAHCADGSGTWLRIRRAGRPGEGLLLEEAVVEAIRFGWIDGPLRRVDADSYLLRFAPRRPGSLWSMPNRQRAESLLTEGRMEEPGRAAVRAAQENGTWETAYSSRSRPVVPEDLAAALAAVPGARGRFDRWAASRRFQYVLWIGQAKRPGTRSRRVDETVRLAGAPAPLRPDLLAPCGIDCGVCSAYLRDRDACCGCMAVGKARIGHCRECVGFLHCPEREKTGARFCSDCRRFPCPRLRRLDRRYATKYGLSPVRNLERIRDEGVDAFLRSEESRWVCPACGGRLCCHGWECPRCGAPRAKAAAP